MKKWFIPICLEGSRYPWNSQMRTSWPGHYYHIKKGKYKKKRRRRKWVFVFAIGSAIHVKVLSLSTWWKKQEKRRLFKWEMGACVWYFNFWGQMVVYIYNIWSINLENWYLYKCMENANIYWSQTWVDSLNEILILVHLICSGKKVVNWGF